jgi:hypothetical protein
MATMRRAVARTLAMAGLGLVMLTTGCSDEEPGRASGLDLGPVDADATTAPAGPAPTPGWDRVVAEAGHRICAEVFPLERYSIDTEQSALVTQIRTLEAALRGIVTSLEALVVPSGEDALYVADAINQARAGADHYVGVGDAAEQGGFSAAAPGFEDGIHLVALAQRSLIAAGAAECAP